MKNNDMGKNYIRGFFEGRAARVCAVAVSVFLCVLSVFELVALEVGVEVPGLEAFFGDAEAWHEESENVGQGLEDDKDIASVETAADEQENGGRHQTVGNGSTEPTQQEDEGEIGETEETEPVISENAVTEEMETADSETVQNVSSEEHSAELTQQEDEGEEELPYYIRVNRKQNCVTVYTMDEKGEYTVPYKAIACSTGAYNTTPKGVFQLSDKYVWRKLNGGVYGQYASRITGAILFHSVPYYSRDKGTLCSEKYNKLGQQASMGCIRLTVEDAKWISENCPSGTTVEIYDDDDPGPLGKPEVVKIDLDSPNKGWDPTDPDEENPWHELSEDS